NTPNHSTLFRRVWPTASLVCLSGTLCDETKLNRVRAGGIITTLGIYRTAFCYLPVRPTTPAATYFQPNYALVRPCFNRCKIRRAAITPWLTTLANVP